MRTLRWTANTTVGLGIDASAPSYVSGHKAMEFAMPVRWRALG